MKAMAVNKAKKISPPDVGATISAVFGCKWSLKILDAIQAGICRPGAIEKALPGLTTRVQNYYFARMMALGIIDKTIYAEMPPRVEYYLTDYGLRIFEILKYIKAVQKDIEAELELANAEGLDTFLTVRD